MVKQLFGKSKLILLLSIFATSIIGQDAGLHLYGGASNMYNKNTIYTPEGMVHGGHHFGGDFQINSGDMYFMLGLQYHRTDLVPAAKSSLKDLQVPLVWIKPRVGLGYNLFHIGKLFTVRAKTLVSVDMMIQNAETTAYVQTPLNDGTASAIGGLGISIGPIRLDAEYHYGLFNAYNKVKDSTYNFWVYSLGFFF
jgi:hypothetical protein